MISWRRHTMMTDVPLPENITEDINQANLICKHSTLLINTICEVFLRSWGNALPPTVIHSSLVGFLLYPLYNTVQYYIVELYFAVCILEK